LALLILTTAAFAIGVWATLAAALVVIIAARIAGIHPWELLRGLKSLFIMLIMIIIFRSITFTPFSFNASGCAEALLFTGNIIVSFSAGALLFSVTTTSELNESLGSAEKRLWKRPRLSLGISLMLGFLPRFFEIWETANCAYRARAGKPGVAFMITIIPLVTERMMETAAETAAALEARGASLRY
jgi:biotin transport system permease protein